MKPKKQQRACPTCGGSGEKFNSTWIQVMPCATCNGTGSAPRVKDEFAEQIAQFHKWLTNRRAALTGDIQYAERCAGDAAERGEPLAALTHQLKADAQKGQLAEIAAMLESWWL